MGFNSTKGIKGIYIIMSIRGIKRNKVVSRGIKRNKVVSRGIKDILGIKCILGIIGVNGINSIIRIKSVYGIDFDTLVTC